MYNKELDKIVRNKTELLHKHIEVLKKQLDERDDAIKKLREELNRPSLLYSKIKEYQQEGYDVSESKSLAKKEVDEIMLDKEGFVSELWDSSYEE